MDRLESVVEVIELLRREYDLWRATLPAHIMATLKSIDDDRSPAAAILYVESSRRVVHLTAWENGNVELVVGDLDSGNILINEHREVPSDSAIRRLFQDVRAALDD